MRLLLCFLTGLGLAIGCSHAAPAQERPALLIVGTPHLANPGRDINNIHVDDVLAPKRQAEIKELVDHLARFKPTRVAIEASPKRQADFTARYEAYRAGTYKLAADERDQIGLRLAAQLNLPGVDCVDYVDGAPGPDSAYDFGAYASAHGQGAYMEELAASGKQMVTAESSFLTSHSLLEWYRHLNDPATLQSMESLYYTIARIGESSAFPGAEWVGAWHARNLIIVEQVRRVSAPADRVLVLFGSGHSYLLREYAAGSGTFHVEDVEKYLR